MGSKTKSLSFKVKDPGVTVVEHLRYAEVIGITGMGHTGWLPYDVARELGEPNLEDDEVIVTISCPKGFVSSVWVEQNIRRLKSFGIKAIVWGD